MHGGRRDVGQVDEHADPLHLPDHRAAEVGQPARLGLVGGRVRPAHVVVVGQRHVPDAERVQRAENAERRTDRVAALRAQQGGDFPGGEDPFHVGGAGRQGQPLRVGPDHPVHQVDLLQHRGHRRVPGQGGGHVDRPELGADAAGGQPWQVGLGLRHRLGQAGPDRVTAERVADLPRQVVVPVDERETAQQIARRGQPVCHRFTLVPADTDHRTRAQSRSIMPGEVTHVPFGS